MLFKKYHGHKKSPFYFVQKYIIANTFDEKRVKKCISAHNILAYINIKFRKQLLFLFFASKKIVITLF